MFFFNKQKQVETQLDEYCRSISICMSKFKAAMDYLCMEGEKSAGQKFYLEVHQSESQADDIRRDIEVLMYSKSLFPESRGDILGLIETMDKVPNQAETVVKMMEEQQIHIPSEFCQALRNLVDLCCKCVDAMLASVGKIFTDFTNSTVIVGKIDELESEADHIESQLMHSIFTSDLGGFEKTLLRDFIKHISQVSDRAENVGDRIRIMVAKRCL